jgi:membrane-associated phospholipid phosphatase
VTVAFVYVAAVSAYLLTHGGWPTPDYLIPPLLLMAVALGRGWSFLLDWGPFLLLLVLWQASAGLAAEVGRPVHVQQLVRADEMLFFGHLPTVWLQERLFDPTRVRWYDWIATGQHAAHFALPIAVGMVIWLRNRRDYWRYHLSVVALFMIGFLLYILYPAAPPWMAGGSDGIPPMDRIVSHTLGSLPAAEPLGLVYTRFSANPVAAMPSLHAAIPVLITLALVKLYGRRAWVALLYPLAMGFNLVYLGEHYVVDIIAGYVVGIWAFLLVWVLPRWLPARPATVRLPEVPVPAVARRAGHALPLAVAGIAALVVFSGLRPPRPEAGPALAGWPALPSPHRYVWQALPCGNGLPRSMALDGILDGVAGEYAVYLLDVEDTSCFALATDDALPPPSPAQTAELAVEAGTQPDFTVADPAADVTELRVGMPSAAVVAAGLPAGRQYVLVIKLADVLDPMQVSAAVHLIARLTIATPPSVAGGASSRDYPRPGHKRFGYAAASGIDS